MSRPGVLYLSAVFVGALIVFVLWVGPFKQSVLFRTLLSVSSDSQSSQFDLLAAIEPTLLRAEEEISALRFDGFGLWPLGTVSTPVSCGSYVLSVDQPLQFRRTGDLLRLDRYTYHIELWVNDQCIVSRATGGIGPVVAP